MLSIAVQPSFLHPHPTSSVCEGFTCGVLFAMLCTQKGSEASLVDPGMPRVAWELEVLDIQPAPTVQPPKSEAYGGINY